jgi:uncharacterized membrane protein
VDYRLLSVFALLCWGAWGFIVKVVSPKTTPESTAFWSTLFGMLPVAAYAFARGSSRWAKPHPLILVSGVAAGLATVFFYIAIRKGPASVVVPLSGMYILIPALLGFVVLKETVTVSHVIGLACAGLAVFFLTR